MVRLRNEIICEQAFYAFYPSAGLRSAKTLEGCSVAACDFEPFELKVISLIIFSYLDGLN